MNIFWFSFITPELSLEVYSEPCQTFKMDQFPKLVNSWKPLAILTKSSILDIWQGSEYASVYYSIWIQLKNFISLFCITIFTRVASQQYTHQTSSVRVVVLEIPRNLKCCSCLKLSIKVIERQKPQQMLP